MSDDERTCCDCRWETMDRPSSANHCRYCKQNGGREDNFTPKPKPIAAKPTRVDINATGRKALDLGQSWIWYAAKWEAKNLRIELRQYKNGCWGVMMVECVVAPDNFVWEET